MKFLIKEDAVDDSCRKFNSAVRKRGSRIQMNI